MESSEAPFMRCLSFPLYKIGKAEFVLTSEQLQAVHRMYGGRDMYAIITLVIMVGHSSKCTENGWRNFDHWSILYTHVPTYIHLMYFTFLCLESRTARISQ